MHNCTDIAQLRTERTTGIHHQLMVMIVLLVQNQVCKRVNISIAISISPSKNAKNAKNSNKIETYLKLHTVHPMKVSHWTQFQNLKLKPNQKPNKTKQKYKWQSKRHKLADISLKIGKDNQIIGFQYRAES